MRSVLALVGGSIAVAGAAQAQMHRITPTLAPAPLAPDLAARTATVRARLPAEQRAWVDAQPRGLDPAAVRGRVAGTFPGGDIDSLTFLVMAGIARDADADLRAQMAQMQAATARNQALRDGAPPSLQPTDSVTDVTETQQMRMQMALDRRVKATEALSNIMKKLAETQGAIVGNLK